MKKTILTLIVLIATISMMAQSPQGISHQAVIRDTANEPVANASIGIRVSILKGGSEGEAVYVETHTPVSNANGLITFVIGTGTDVSGSFSDIDWSDGPFFLQTEADPDGGTGYSISGVTQFFSLPYSLYTDLAEYAETYTGLDALLTRVEALEEALDTDDPAPFSLHLEAAPENAGTVTGAGEYMAGEQVNITATANEGWHFVNWTGDTGHVADPASANPTVTMPAQNISLTANFEESDETTSTVTFFVKDQQQVPLPNAQITIYSLGAQDKGSPGNVPIKLIPPSSASGSINNKLHAGFEASGDTKPGNAPFYPVDKGAGEWIKYWQTGVNDNAIGLGGSYEQWYVAIRWMPADLVVYEGHAVTRIRVFMNHAPLDATAMVWQGTLEEPKIMLSKPMEVAEQAWVEVELPEPYPIDTTQELWIGWRIGDQGDGVFPAAFETSAQYDGLANLLQFSNNPWQYASAFSFNLAWNIEAFVLNQYAILHTDGNGEASFEASDGNYAFFVAKEGYVSDGSNFSVDGEDVLIDVILPRKYALDLSTNPENAGMIGGAGEYMAGEQVNINATANEGWEFVEWTGDTEHVADPASSNTTVTMPAQDIALTANFQEIVYGEGVTDIDGNEYVTVIIGNQEWMAKNLRVTKYNNGDAIPTGLSNTEWENTTNGSYAIYPHTGGLVPNEPVEGINSDEEMAAAYGKLYNWYAVDDSRGLCPVGWSVPSSAEWSALVNNISSQGFPNFADNPNGAGNALKSCRQVGHPDGGDCDTSLHPRWDSDGTHHGFDEFGFSALPGGIRTVDGYYRNIGHTSFWWSSSEHSSTHAMRRSLYSALGNVSAILNWNKSLGFSVRCFREVTPPEDD